MITLILGRKGSGKTKRLIDLCNQATDQSKGNVVFIEKEGVSIYDVSHKARLVVADEYGVKGFDAFYGFIAGMCAANYDLTDVFVDYAEDRRLRHGGAGRLCGETEHPV